MNKGDSRSQLYSVGTRKAIRVSAAIAIFALAYAVVAVAIGFIPINLMLRRMMGPAIMHDVWVNSAVQLAERTAVAALACWLALSASGRGRGRLTGRGMLAVGVVMSGALTGALDVGAHQIFVGRLIQAAHTAPWRGHLLSDSMTLVISAAITLLFITRSTSVLKVE